MLLTCKIRIFPTKNQECVLWDLSERCRLLYNFALMERNIIWQQEKDFPPDQREFITYQDQQNGLPELKRRFPEYKQVYSKVLQMVLKTLDANFKSFVALWKKSDSTARVPRYRGKVYFFTLKYNQSGFKVENDTLVLSHKHPSGMKLVFALPYFPGGTVKQVELYRVHATGEWFISLVIDNPVPEYRDNGLYQAFDPGIENLVAATNSQGQHLLIKNRRPDKYWRPKIAEVQAKRDRCKKGSRRYRWYGRKLNKMQQRQANQTRDYQHFISNRIVKNTRANTLIIGKPGVKEMAKNRKGRKTKKAARTLHHSLQNTGTISRFAGYVTYKAEKLGKKVIRIGEDCTTQICPRCGYLKKRKLSERRIACGNCGYTDYRDVASSTNLLASFYIQKDRFEGLLHEPSVNEELFLLRWKGFLRQTANGKTEVSIAGFWQRFGGLVDQVLPPAPAGQGFGTASL
ncbi:MAG: RNA-guided endonuclease InsQ/TnpB family protein [Candidatus Odinarchaeota archaeon]